MFKILSKKKYNKLIEDFEELQEKVEGLKRINESIGKKLEDKKTSCKLNNGKDFCFSCKNSYRYKTYWGVEEIEKCGCLLDVPCENFKRKESERFRVSNNANIVIAQALMMRIKDYAERALDRKDVTIDMAMVEIRDTVDAYDEYFRTGRKPQ